MNWIYNLIYGIKDKEIQELETKLEEVTSELEKIKEKEIINQKEQYYTYKYPFKDISYQRTDKLGIINIDVRQFLNSNNYLLPKFTGTNDEIAFNSLIWVIKNIKYVTDKTKYGLEEYWAFGYETLNHLKGDCEDGAILLYDILRFNGISAWKIRLSAGWVSYNNKKEGHAYITYYCEETDKWVILDWCYFPNFQEIKLRQDYKNDKMYGSVWFSFNEDYSWSQGLNTSAKRVLKQHK